VEPHPTKKQVIDLMRRIGLQDRIPEAEHVLPDVVDLHRDEVILAHLGLGVDEANDRLGGSP
jgi:hypothetical protein